MHGLGQPGACHQGRSRLIRRGVKVTGAQLFGLPRPGIQDDTRGAVSRPAHRHLRRVSDTVDIKVTVIGTRRPIVHPPTAKAAQAFTSRTESRP